MARFRTGDTCRFVGTDGKSFANLLQLQEYDRCNKVWYATSPVHGTITVSARDIERLPRRAV